MWNFKDGLWRFVFPLLVFGVRFYLKDTGKCDRNVTACSDWLFKIF